MRLIWTLILDLPGRGERAGLGERLRVLSTGGKGRRYRRETLSSFRCAFLGLPFEKFLERQGDDRDHAEQRRDGEGAGIIVLVIEDLDVQRQRIGLAAYVAGHDRYRAELAQRASRT